MKVNETYQKEISALLTLPEVQKALKFLEDDAEATLAQQVTITEIPSPPFKETARATYFMEALKKLNINISKLDEVGNSVGIYGDKSSGPTLLASAHIDSVFDEGTDVSVTVKDGIYYAPGIVDDARGLAATLSIIRALNHAGIELGGNLMIGGNVGEEGPGDLRGIKHLFKTHSDIDGFISIDGQSHEEILFKGTGSFRYLYEFSAPGGHSFGNFGRPSAVHAAGRLIAKIADLPVSKVPKATFNVGVVEGGTLMTAIAEKCILQVDLRSDDAGVLKEMDETVQNFVKVAIIEENKRATDTGIPVTVKTTKIGNRPAGSQPDDSPIVKIAAMATAELGFTPILLEGASSTDANLPISLGIPALCLGAGGHSENAHSLNEWFDPTNAHFGPQRVLLVILALLGVKGKTESLLEKR